MAQIRSFLFFRHLRAEPNQYILHYKHGEVVLRGAGISYCFNPLSAALVQVPVENTEVTFLLKERTVDFQQVSVQCTLVYRIADPQLAAARFNFSISIDRGTWLEEPLEKLTSIWVNRVQQPARHYLTGVSVVEALRDGVRVIPGAIEEALRADTEIEGMGLALVSVQVTRIAPTAELEKALQAPTREEIQQKADEAVFQRRAQAVEKERAIKENELASEIELARRRENLSQQQGANALLLVQREAEAEKTRSEASAERDAVAAEAYSRDTLTRSQGDAGARKLLADAEVEAEGKRLAIWKDAPARVVLGLALRELAGNVDNIQHLNLTPDLMGQALQQFLRDQADQ